MKKILIILLMSSLLLFGGCSNANVLVGLYGDNGEVVTQNQISYQTKQGNIYYNNFDKTLTSGENLYFLECPNNAIIHFNSLTLSAENPPVKIELYENPIIANNGTKFNLTNSNRNYNNNQTINTYMNPTITNDGTLIYSNYILGTNNNRIIEQFNLNGELILNNNYCYTIKITNEDNADNHIVGTLFIYKE